jgi:hypothetical protein
MIISSLLTPKNARKPKKSHNSLKFETLLAFFSFFHHGRHRVVQIYTWAGPLYSNFTPSESEGENLRI